MKKEEQVIYAFQKYLHAEFEFGRKYIKNNKAVTPRELAYIDELFDSLDTLVAQFPSRIINKRNSRKQRCPDKQYYDNTRRKV